MQANTTQADNPTPVKSWSQMSRQELMDYLATHPNQCQEGQEPFEEFLKHPPSPEELTLAQKFRNWQQNQV